MMNTGKKRGGKRRKRGIVKEEKRKGDKPEYGEEE